MPHSKPAAVLVPGVISVGTSVYEPLVVELKAFGFSKIETINLPSIDTIANKSSIKPTAFEADVAAVHSAVQQFIKEGQDVVLVAHSYGGSVALCAAQGLWKSQTQSHGVIRACLLSSSLSLPGQSQNSARDEWGAKNPGRLPEYKDVQVETVDDEIFFLPGVFERDWFADFPPDEFKKWAATLRPCALTAVITPVPETVTPSAWKISILITTGNDPPMPVDFQEFLIEQGKAAGATIDEVKRIETSHFVQITHAKEVAEWVAEQCEKA